ncbi:MAG: hypothetical protein JJE52_03480 [Acidimicrobiia bacterium]|nr:hypothetical protein [Acidimicrobiia bacterium]
MWTVVFDVHVASAAELTPDDVTDLIEEISDLLDAHAQLEVETLRTDGVGNLVKLFLEVNVAATDRLNAVELTTGPIMAAFRAAGIGTEGLDLSEGFYTSARDLQLA